MQIAENAATNGGFELVVPPLDFTISGVCNDPRIEVIKFNAYVTRMIAIPEGITTGVVVERTAPYAPCRPRQKLTVRS